MIPRSLVFQARAGQRQSGLTAGREYSFRCISREAQQRHSNGGKHMCLEFREIQAGDECLIDYVNNTNISSNLHIDHVNSASTNKFHKAHHCMVKTCNIMLTDYVISNVIRILMVSWLQRIFERTIPISKRQVTISSENQTLLVVPSQDFNAIVTTGKTKSTFPPYWRTVS